MLRRALLIGLALVAFAGPAFALPASARGGGDVWVVEISAHAQTESHFHSTSGSTSSNRDQSWNASGNLRITFDAALQRRQQMAMGYSHPDDLVLIGNARMPGGEASGTGTGSENDSDVEQSGGQSSSDTTTFSGHLDAERSPVQFLYMPSDPTRTAFSFALMMVGNRDQTSTDSNGKNVHSSGQWGQSIACPIQESGSQMPKATPPIDHIRKVDGGYTIDWTYHRENAQKNGKETVDVECHVSILFNPPNLTLKVMPKGYASWLPEGGTADRGLPSRGNVLDIELLMVDRRTQKPQPAKKIVVELAKVSHEPGVCMNEPPDGTSEDTPDYRFEPDLNNEAGMTVIDEKVTIEAPDGTNDRTVHLSSFDGGGYATLRVTAEPLDPKSPPVRGRLEPTGEEEILIPKRKSADTRIGDAWAHDGADDADDDVQPGNPQKGDGFTLYEEYRGVRAKDRCVRLLPDKKDLVVENQLNAANDANMGVIRAGFARFERASGIHVVEVEPGRLRKSRLVNANESSTFRGAQYGLRLVAAKIGDIGVGQDPTNGLDPDPPHGKQAKPLPDIPSPRFCTEMAITDEWEGALAKQGADAADTFATTVAHEMGHCLHLDHHGDHFGDPRIALNHGPWLEFDEHGQPVKPPNISDLGGKDDNINYPDGPASGDPECIMTYTANSYWLYKVDAQGHIEMHKVPPWKPGTKFCTASDGSPPSKIGPAPNGGNCLSKMVVKDW